MSRILPGRISRHRLYKGACWAAGAAGGAMPWLLRRMRHEMLVYGRLSTPTAAMMWAGYGIHFTVLAAALARRPPDLPMPVPLKAAVVAATAAGAGLVAAAQHRFAGPAELTGTRQQQLLTVGVYRYSRNPQYTGLISLLAGISVMRRSASAVFLVLVLARVFRAWVPVEEQHLSSQFGPAYLRYMAETPRWLNCS